MTEAIENIDELTDKNIDYIGSQFEADKYIDWLVPKIASYDKSVCVYSVPEFELMTRLQDHSNRIEIVAFSADYRYPSNDSFFALQLSLLSKMISIILTALYFKSNQYKLKESKRVEIYGY
eukprot:Mrub_14106.p1 GENE.Mrub_14106~~Mrub_14106.p1  ORF type:complete len:121 (-),score=4.91 Mrub_14106:54-416(-)